MPFLVRDGTRLYWRLDGAADRPPLVLLNSIGSDMALFDPAAAILQRHFQLVRMDTRGHGASDAPAGDYALSTLADDALAVMDAAGVGQAAVCGVSMGGMVAMQMALAAPNRVRALIAACTTAAVDPLVWQARIEAIAAGGMAAIADMAMGRYFSDDFRRDCPEVVGTARHALLTMAPEGYMGCSAAIRDMDLASRLPTIRAPTLVIAGAKDVSTPFEGNGDKIVAAIPGARSVILNAAHLACLEDPDGFASALREFLGA